MLGSANSAGGGRQYDPQIARFLSEDPAKDDLNDYRYRGHPQCTLGRMERHTRRQKVLAFEQFGLKFTSQLDLRYSFRWQLNSVP